MEKIQEYKCPCCGAPLRYDGNAEKLRCASCDNTYPVAEMQDIAEAEQKMETDAAYNWETGIGALGGVLADAWCDYFYCESMDADILVVKGEKRKGGRSSNKKGTDNIISNGSIININDGQCMIALRLWAETTICSVVI